MSDIISAEPEAGVAFDTVVPVEQRLQSDLSVLPELLQGRSAGARPRQRASSMSTEPDTGRRPRHRVCAPRTSISPDGSRPSRNFTTDNNGSTHRTRKTGRATAPMSPASFCAGGVHTGMAPLARTSCRSRCSTTPAAVAFSAIRDASALGTVANRPALGISVVCMSLGASDNNTTDAGFAGDGARRGVALNSTDAGVACCVAAGNDYSGHSSAQGMSYPAIFRQTISVGAVYDADEGSFSYGIGATALSTAPDRITPFSQRLHASAGRRLRDRHLRARCPDDLVGNPQRHR